MRIQVAADDADFARRAADIVCEVVRQRPDAAIGLPSGKTPLGVYAELTHRARDGETDFSGVSAFAIDELHGIPPDHPATNATYFRLHVTAHLPVRGLQVMDSETKDPAAECARFRRLIYDAGGFDLVVLGIGLNGHIAFNEPGSSFDSRARRVVLDQPTREAYAQICGSTDDTPEHGLTLGIADLMEARRALLLATGGVKAVLVAQTLEGPITEALPASALQKHTSLTVVLDRAAASGLLNP